MKIKANVNSTALGMSDRAKTIRMDRAGVAGVLFTAVGLVLTAVSYATYMHGTVWTGVYDDDMEGRSIIDKAYKEAYAKLMNR